VTDLRKKEAHSVLAVKEKEEEKQRLLMARKKTQKKVKTKCCCWGPTTLGLGGSGHRGLAPSF
jgi:hypothetical protein